VKVRFRGYLPGLRTKIVPGLVSISLLTGLVVSIFATRGAQADYYIGCGYGYSSGGNLGYGYGYGYGYDLNGQYGYGYGSQVCPQTSSGSGSGSGNAGATTTTTNTTTTTRTPPTTTTTTAPKKKKRVPSLLAYPGLRVYFANDSTVLTKIDKNNLNNLAAEVIADHTTHLNITGYASIVGDPGINLPLSLHRAEVVEAYLMAIFSAHGYTAISFTVSGNGVLTAFPNYALDRVVIVSS